MTDAWLRYYRVALSEPNVTEAVESFIETLSDGYRTSLEEIALGQVGGAFTYDQVAEVVAGLEDLGVLGAVAQRVYVVNRKVGDSSALLRRQVRAALVWANAGSSPELCELLLAVPRDGRELITTPYEKSFLDLRTAVRSLAASAARRLILASPFWDMEVAADIGALIERRLAAGAEVVVLARSPAAGTGNREALNLLTSISVRDNRCQTLVLDRYSERDPFGSSTFHFKAACADGNRVYLGSANFNTAGLSSRWELGVLLDGTRAQPVVDLLDSLVSIARPLRES